MKFYFIIIVICIIFIYISYRSNKKNEKKSLFLQTTKCSYCGLVFPSNEAVFDSNDRAFCCDEHQKKINEA